MTSALAHDAGRTQARPASIASPSQHRAGVRPLRNLHPARPRHRRSQKYIQPLGGAAKRVTDLVVAGAALLALAPLLLLIGLLIRMDSPGPALFLQRRGGFRGRPFLVCKFRTMRTADDGKAIVQAQRGDSRVTKLGAFLRKTSLDELPQLLNVLRGEMSIVGPRPHALAHDAEFATVEPAYRQRHEARPGITGLAQVSGYRGLAPDSESVRARTWLDIEYVETWSWWRDLSIMFRTLFVVLHDDNAF